MGEHKKKGKKLNFSTHMCMFELIFYQLETKKKEKEEN